MKKRLLLLISILAIALFTIIGCSSNEEVDNAQPQQSGNDSQDQNPGNQDSQKDSAKADGYPEKAINLIVPFDPGGGSDVMSRVVEQYWEDEFGVPIKFNYRSGAAGAVGMLEVANTSNDGYTISTFNFPHVVLQPLSGAAQYKIDDFEYIAQLASDLHLLVVPADSPYQTLDDFVAAAKENPGTLSINTSGLMDSTHLTYRQFVNEAGIDAPIVPFQSGGEQLSAVLGGQVDAGTGTMGTMLGEVQAGNLRALAISSAERSDVLPDVPTFKEQGLDVEVHIGRLWMTPAGVDPEKLQRLREGMKNIADNPEFQEKMINQGYSNDWMDGEELKQYIEDFNDRAMEIIEQLEQDMN